MNKQYIGRLDRIITIEQLVQTQGETYGEPVEQWTPWATVWANKWDGGGREFEAARQINAEIDTQFQIKYLEGLKTTMRITCNGLLYDIYRIQEVGRNDRLNVWAKAREAA